MKITVGSFSKSGGAGGVANRLSQTFESLGHMSNLVTVLDTDLRSEPLSSPISTGLAAFDNYVVKKREWDALFSLYRYWSGKSVFRDRDDEACILRWPIGMISADFANYYENKPVLWGLPDTHAFTGGCHYSQHCTRFKTGCNDCPAVRGVFRKSVAASLASKNNLYSRLNKLVFIAPSLWIKNEFLASTSSNYAEVEVIPNPIDLSYFENSQGRRLSGTPPIKIGFTAANLDDPVKGFSRVEKFLREAVTSGKVTLSFAGKPTEGFKKRNSHGFFHGPLTQSGMIDFYDSIDILIVPSTHEALGMVSIEAQARGVPVIVSQNGGLAETVSQGGGWTFNDEAGLGRLIGSMDPTLYHQKSMSAVASANKSHPTTVARNYLSKIEELL